jgi:hypothetical protein
MFGVDFWLLDTKKTIADFPMSQQIGRYLKEDPPLMQKECPSMWPNLIPESLDLIPLIDVSFQGIERLQESPQTIFHFLGTSAPNQQYSYPQHQRASMAHHRYFVQRGVRPQSLRRWRQDGLVRFFECAPRSLETWSASSPLVPSSRARL